MCSPCFLALQVFPCTGWLKWAFTSLLDSWSEADTLAHCGRTPELNFKVDRAPHVKISFHISPHISNFQDSRSIEASATRRIHSSTSTFFVLFVRIICHSVQMVVIYSQHHQRSSVSLLSGDSTNREQPGFCISVASIHFCSVAEQYTPARIHSK